MAFFRQSFGSLTADDCADWQSRISVPTSSPGSSPVRWKGRTRSSKHSATSECSPTNESELSFHTIPLAEPWNDLDGLRETWRELAGIILRTTRSTDFSGGLK